MTRNPPKGINLTRIPKSSQTSRITVRANELTLTEVSDTRSMFKHGINRNLSLLNTKDVQRMNNNQIMNSLLMGGAIKPPYIPRENNHGGDGEN